MHWLDTLRSSVLALPDLAKFAVVIAVMVGIPPIARCARLPEMIGLLLFEMIGLLLFGVILGRHVLGFFGEHRPIADFFAELGKLLRGGVPRNVIAIRGFGEMHLLVPTATAGRSLAGVAQSRGEACPDGSKTEFAGLV
jgi:hypothetical protein